MKKFLLSVVLSVLFVVNSAFAMTFQQPVKIGSIGFPAQAPYNGYLVEGATFNDGNPFTEEFERNGEPIKTFTKGTAQFSAGTNALWCKYNYTSQGTADDFIIFGGRNDFVLTTDASYKEVFKIDGDTLTLYAIYHNYCVTDLKILGKQQRGKWVIFIDSKKISNKYFDGKDSYKEDGGVLYDVPTCAGDTLIVKYRRWHWSESGGISDPEGEFRFKWDERAQSFGVEQIVY